MKYYSTNKNSPLVSFREAVISGLAPDGGLYMPERIPELSKDLWKTKNLSLHEIGFEVSKQFIDHEIPMPDLERIISNAFNFIIPVFPLERNIFCMELFHGPTLAFKDVGARFMAEVLSHFAKNESGLITILTATSGDTGSAVANAFYEKEGIRVMVLYPKNGVSPLQEKQMTSLGKNISAIAVDGTFDDCQRLAKTSFADKEMARGLNLTSANSINIARLIPQSFYYLYAYTLLKSHSDEIVYSVPSGNFGNLTAGILAKRMGMRAKFIAATNRNNVFTEYLHTGILSPRPSQRTISNAMDVGNPSNFARILNLYSDDAEEIKKDISSHSVSDDKTRETILKVFRKKKYLLDPHGSVSYSALQKYFSSLSPFGGGQTTGVVLATAHPAKFREVMEETLGEKVFLPERLQKVMQSKKSAVELPADFSALKEFLFEKKYSPLLF